VPADGADAGKGSVKATIGELFCGVKGFGLGFEAEGFRTAWQVEKDKDCRALLAGKDPKVLRLEDVREAKGLPYVDVITGGFPCQDLSLAGKREGLAGTRSGLWWEMLRIINETKPAFVVWENVAGLFSSDEGRDLARVCFSLVECGYSGCCRAFDAQYFGLAQRRRRIIGVFARGDFGAECCTEILSIAEGMRWHSAPRREKGKAVARAIGACAARGGPDGHHGKGELIPMLAGTVGGGFRTTDLDNQGAFIPVVAHSLNAQRDGYNDGSDQTYIPAVAWAIQERDGKGPDSNTKDGHLLAIPIQSVGTQKNQHGVGVGRPGDPMYSLTVSDVHAVAYRTSGNCGAFEQGDKTAALNCGTDPTQQVIAFQPRIGRNGRGRPETICPTLNGTNAGDSSDSKPVIALPYAVRRLTPLEWERLQGFPDGWTAGFSDSTRYRMLGNAFPPPMAGWVARRLLPFLGEQKRRRRAA
jgi:site-specific DNA-cytosine methylase